MNKNIIIWAIITILTATIATATINDAVVYYSFDTAEINTTHALDISSAPNYHGTRLNSIATTANGRLNQAFKFDGSDDEIDLYPASITNFTFCAWINYTSTTPVYNTIVGVGNNKFQFFVDTQGGVGTNKLKVWVNNANSYIGNTALTANKEYHACVTLDPYTNKIQFYLNGTADSALTALSNDPTNYSGWDIGENDIAGDVFAGMIDEVALYNRILTSAEISELRNITENPYTLDTITVTINTPANNTIIYQGNFTARFNYTATNSKAGNCSLYLNNTLKSTRRSITSGSNNTQINATGITEGTYNWRIRCNATGINNTNSTTRKIRYFNTSNHYLTVKAYDWQGNDTIGYAEITVNGVTIGANPFQNDLEDYINGTTTWKTININITDLSNRHKK